MASNADFVVPRAKYSPDYSRLSTSPTEGQRVWKDKENPIRPDDSGATKPSYLSFRNNLGAYAFAVADAVDVRFHMPHDWAYGTDIFFHLHLGHNATNVSGDVVWDYEASFVKRVDTGVRDVVDAPVTGQITSTIDITNFPQYCHWVHEIQLTAASPSASQLATGDFEVDGLLEMHLALNALPGTFTGGNLFLFTADLHYQATGIGTIGKNPDFYVAD